MAEVEEQVVVHPAYEDFLPGSGVGVAPQAVEPPAAPANAPPQPAAQAEVAPATEAPADDIVEDPYEKAVLESLAPAQEEVTFSDDELAKVEKVLGTKDLKAFKGQFSTYEERISLLDKQVSELTPLKTGLESFTPALSNAFRLALDGKVEEAQEFLRELPKGVLLNKEAKSIPTKSLLKTYLPDKMSDEDFAVLEDPDSDPDEVKAIKAREKHYRDIASDMHERKRQEVAEANAASDREWSDRRKNYEEGVAATLANVKNTPLKAFADQGFMQSIQDGTWKGLFVKEDGVTPTPEQAARLLRAIHGEKLEKAQYNVGYKKGLEVGKLEMLAQSGGGSVNGRQGSTSGPGTQNQDPYEQFLPGARI